MKFIKLFLILIFYCSYSFANSNNQTLCADAGTDVNKFLQSSISAMLSISQSRLSPDLQDAKLKQIIAECTDSIKVSKRVLGRRKWLNLNQEEQKNFLSEYPIYFIKIFKDITLNALKGVKSFEIDQSSVQNTYTIILDFIDNNQNQLSFNLIIEEKKGRLYITDGQFFNVSIVGAQRDMFDRIYEQNPNIIKYFNAKEFLKNQ